MRTAFLIFLVLMLMIPIAGQINTRVISTDTSWPLVQIVYSLGVRGKVTVDVSLNADGSVGNVKGRAGNALLQKAAERSVSQWKFEPDSTNRLRELNLDFQFVDEPKQQLVEMPREREIRVEVLPSGPNDFVVTGRVTHFVSKTILIPRVDGAVLEKKCELHNAVMKTELVDVIYGLTVPAAGFEDLFEVRDKLFPNARFVVFAGCLVEAPERQEVYFCDLCRAAEKQWTENRERELKSRPPRVAKK